MVLADHEAVLVFDDPALFYALVEGVILRDVEGEVEFAREQVLVFLVPVYLDRLYRHIGTEPGETPEDFGLGLELHDAFYAYGEVALLPREGGGCAAHGLVKAREQAHAIDVEALAGIREGHPPGAADEERKAQFVLQ